MTRQGRAQVELRRADKCQKCKAPRGASLVYCDDCAERHRTASRNRYRRRVGIPLDAPLIKSGRRRKT